ncbi:TonB-dependent receptor [Novosphingobium sp. Rr 2-17]|uniref:TonB-dependent siderophore receptor n=1 Tax=Novosphingobium sp. Rr 2-17 TaxID=555793 RepID=UPI000269980A|nr:TonB-dependent receptor plug domain-containing protein [Novosphingobium sp. Rr 2-17]EIZ81050.1 TonB-dependent receptor [Novosphingobium sp. Rr 2-17]
MRDTTKFTAQSRLAAMQRTRAIKGFAAVAGTLLGCTALTAPAFAQEAPAEETPKEEIVVTGSLGALPIQDVGSVFGFNKTLVETPRSASSISKEQIERFGVTDIYDLVAQAPGTFTNSFFGVGGALDIRGTPGEVYFRGVRRLDNPGNYPTPIGASDRIDIVRGPASVIYGPSKTGGYMNFVPKSGRAQGGSYLTQPEGQITYTGGSWSKNDLKAEVRGPGKIGTQEFGYSVFAEVEDSGSYYNNIDTKQAIVQGSFDTDLAPNLRLEFGGMYHNYRGAQNGGWNRVTQDLIDNGTYITGTAQAVDDNGDGQVSQSELNAHKVGSIYGSYACGGNSMAAGLTDACLKNNYPQYALTDVGTTKLSRKDVLTGKEDRLDNKATTFYADLVYDAGDGWDIKNQLFYDGYHNINENSYGFSQFHKSWVIEDKIVVAKTFESDAGKFAFQASPSIRYTHFKHGDDYNYETFNRVDLSVGYNATSDRLLSTECNCDYTNYLKGHYTDLGMAGLADLNFNFGLDLTLGLRYDHISVKTSYVPEMMEETPTELGNPDSASASKGAVSWTASASYKLPLGLIPYVTVSKQAVVVAGQGAEIYAESVAGDAWISASKLYEVGIKGEFLDKRLYAALSVYKQKRTDFNTQSITVNQAVETKGMEAEVRWSVDRHLLVTAAYTRTKVYNLTAYNAGTLFSYFGAGDAINVSDPSLFYGGNIIGNVDTSTKNKSRRAGIPTNLYSATATYAFDNGIALSGSVVKVPSVYTSQSQVVKLPAYTLFDLGASFTTGPWLFNVVVKNATNEKYYRANFTELFGATIVLPEKPRSIQASVTFKFH